MVYTDFGVCLMLVLSLLLLLVVDGAADATVSLHLDAPTFSIMFQFVSCVICTMNGIVFVVFAKRSAMESTFDGIALNTILIDIVKCILFNKIPKN